MKLLKLLVLLFPVLISAATVPVIESPSNDMKPSIASYDIDSPSFTLAWERGDTTVSCTIYVAIGNTDFTNIIPIQLTNGNYIDKNPVVTFVDSLHPVVIWERKNGSYFQLYSSHYQGNDSWSYPEQVFAIQGDEVYTYPHKPYLYFESIGRIYRSYFNGVSWSSTSIVSDLGYDGYCHHPSYSISEGLVYEVNSSGDWRIYHNDSLLSDVSSSPMYPMVTDYGNYLYTIKSGNIYSLILFDGLARNIIDTSGIFIGHHKIVDVGMITKENMGDFECYVKDENIRNVYAYNLINNQKYLLNSGDYNADYPSTCVVNGYRTLYKVPVVFQELHNGKWDLYGDIFYLTNGGVRQNIPNEHKEIKIRYMNNTVEITMKTGGKIYGVNGVLVKNLKPGTLKIPFNTMARGIYFVKSFSGQIQKFIIK